MRGPSHQRQQKRGQRKQLILASLVPAGGHLTNRQIDIDAGIGCLLTLIDLAGRTASRPRH
jgi:hypothetical protein